MYLLSLVRDIKIFELKAPPPPKKKPGCFLGYFPLSDIKGTYGYVNHPLNQNL